MAQFVAVRSKKKSLAQWFCSRFRVLVAVRFCTKQQKLLAFFSCEKLRHSKNMRAAVIEPATSRYSICWLYDWTPHASVVLWEHFFILCGVWLMCNPYHVAAPGWLRVEQDTCREARLLYISYFSF